MPELNPARLRIEKKGLYIKEWILILIKELFRQDLQDFSDFSDFFPGFPEESLELPIAFGDKNTI
jgi:hypothetical protein